MPRSRHEVNPLHRGRDGQAYFGGHLVSPGSLPYEDGTTVAVHASHVVPDGRAPSTSGDISGWLAHHNSYGSTCQDLI